MFNSYKSIILGTLAYLLWLGLIIGSIIMMDSSMWGISMLAAAAITVIVVSVIFFKGLPPDHGKEHKRSTTLIHSVPTSSVHPGLCIVCFRALGPNNIVLTPCNHAFHSDCFKTYQNKDGDISENCPECFEPLNEYTCFVYKDYDEDELVDIAID